MQCLWIKTTLALIQKMMHTKKMDICSWHNLHTYQVVHSQANSTDEREIIGMVFTSWPPGWHLCPSLCVVCGQNTNKQLGPMRPCQSIQGKITLACKRGLARSPLFQLQQSLGNIAAHARQPFRLDAKTRETSLTCVREKGVHFKTCNWSGIERNRHQILSLWEQACKVKRHFCSMQWFQAGRFCSKSDIAVGLVLHTCSGWQWSMLAYTRQNKYYTKKQRVQQNGSNCPASPGHKVYNITVTSVLSLVLNTEEFVQKVSILHSSFQSRSSIVEN